MRWRYKLPLRLRSLFRREQAEQELDEEIQFHFQSLVDQYVSQGMSPNAARRAAFHELGHYFLHAANDNRGQVKETEADLFAELATGEKRKA